MAGTCDERSRSACSSAFSLSQAIPERVLSVAPPLTASLRFYHKQPGGPGDLRLTDIWRRPCRSILQKQDAFIQNPGRDKIEGDVRQPFKGPLNACLRENQGANDEFEAVHQASRKQLLDQRHTPQGAQLGAVSSL